MKPKLFPTSLVQSKAYLKFITNVVTVLAIMGIGGLASTALAAGSATLYLTPSSGSYAVGQTLIVNIYTSISGDSANAVEADFSYPTSTLSFQSIDGSSSAFSISASQTGGSGEVKIARGNTTGLTGTQLVAAVHFTVLATGSAGLSFLGSSAVASSTTNMNILGSTTGANLTLAAAATPAPSTPKPSSGASHPTTPVTSSGSKTATPTPKPSTTPTPSSGTSVMTPTPAPMSAMMMTSPTPAPSHSSTKLLGVAAFGIPILALLVLGAFILSRSHMPKMAAHNSDVTFAPPTTPLVPPSAPITPTTPPANTASAPPPPPSEPPTQSSGEPPAQVTPPSGSSSNQIYYPDTNSKHDGST